MRWLKKSLLSVLKGAGALAYSYCVCYTVTHHVISYIVVSARVHFIIYKGIKF